MECDLLVINFETCFHIFQSVSNLRFNSIAVEIGRDSWGRPDVNLLIVQPVVAILLRQVARNPDDQVGS